MTAPLPDVAVVIPLYNGAEWIRETLASVLAQTHRPVEIVVVDDGSTDGSAALAASVVGVRLVPNERTGANPARRHGQALTAAPLVAFLDQDDLWHPDHLRLLATALAKDPDATAAVSADMRFSESPPAFDAPALRIAPVDPWASFPTNFTGTPSGVLIRREALEAVGGWTDAYLGVADLYMWLRLSERRPLVQNGCRTAAYRWHARSQSVRLRAERLPFFAGQAVRATHDATRHREVCRPEERAHLGRRRALISSAEALLLALASGDRTSSARAHVQSAARALEPTADGEPDEWVRNSLEWMFYFLDTVGAQERGGVAARWGWLVDAWPAPAVRAGEQLRRLACRRLGGRRFVARVLMRQPFSCRRWQWFVAATVGAERERR